MEWLVGQKRTVLVEAPDFPKISQTRFGGFTEDYFRVQFPGSGPGNCFADVKLVSLVSKGEGLIFEGTAAEWEKRS